MDKATLPNTPGHHTIGAAGQPVLVTPADRPPAREIAKALKAAHRDYLSALTARNKARKKLVAAETTLQEAKRRLNTLLDDTAAATQDGGEGSP
jgi:SLT domain-containing protein